MNIVASHQATLGRLELRVPTIDYLLLGAGLALMGLGWVMVASASITIADRHFGQPFYYAIRQGIYIVIALCLGSAVFRVRFSYWKRASFFLLVYALALLLIVLIPGIGKEVNGSMRWISLGLVNLQASELAKLLLLIYLAGYLVRHREEVSDRASGFFKPMAVLSVACFLLLMEPDFGAAAVLMTTALMLLFLAGVRWRQFLMVVAGAAIVVAMLVMSAPYRLQRLTAFLNPWADPFNSGFQLTQSLIAFGRGEWFGVGLGAGIQKLFYLPEAHTDFLLAVLGEELGLVGILVVITLFSFMVYRAFHIGCVAEMTGNLFSAYCAYAIGIWLGLQSFINMGVSMGLLPTKGLTLPLLSYGGSSLIVSVMAIAMLLRIDYESRFSIDYVDVAKRKKKLRRHR
ncbi:MAG: putative lipid II flippase FtsW [Gammaproteobacteria bacterium]